MSKYLIFAVPALIALHGCGPAQNDPGPGGVTVGEAKALDDAAKMLDERNEPAAKTDQSDEKQVPEPAPPK